VIHGRQCLQARLGLESLKRILYSLHGVSAQRESTALQIV
jgi:hypothetical protein